MIILVTGGTGGHVFPALAVYKDLKDDGYNCKIIVDQRGKRFIPNDVDCLEMEIHRHFPPFGKFFYPLSLCGAFISCVFRFLMNRPKIVVGFGSYTTLPALFAAAFLRIPVAIHEGNKIMGKANRLLQKIAKVVVVSFPNTKTEHKNTVVTGMPLRSAFFKDYNYHFPKEDELFHILVVGGSQGASLFAKLIPDAIADLPIDLQKRLVIHHQCRQEQMDLTRQEYAPLSCDFLLRPFFEDMPNQYDFAHLVITRAGASSIFELSVTKRPGILYPFLASVEGDQAKNAKAVEELGGCWVFNEKETGPRCLADLLQKIILNPSMLEEKSKNIEKLLEKNPTKALVDIIKKVM